VSGRLSLLRIVLFILVLVVLFSAGMLIGRRLLNSGAPATSIPTVTVEGTSTPVVYPTETPTPLPTFTPTPTFTPVISPTPTPISTYTPTPTATMSNPITPTSTPTPCPTPEAATPTFTPEVSPAPSASVPAPALVEPANGATVLGTVTFRWEWSGQLADNQWFDVIFKQGEKLGFRHSKDKALEIDRPPIDFGPYQWWVRIAVFDGDPDAGGKFVKHISGESEHWHFTWDVKTASPREEPSPSEQPPPMPTPTEESPF